MKRPRIKVEPTTADHIMEVTGALFLILMLGSVWYYYDDLPADIPTHFNSAGDPDAYGQKSSVLLLPAITLVVCLGMFFLNRYPHIFNYPLKITPDNAKRQYQLASRMMRTLNMMIAGSFFYISYSTIQVALGEKDGLGQYFLPVFLVAMFTPIVIYLVQAWKKPSKSTFRL